MRARQLIQAFKMIIDITRDLSNVDFEQLKLVLDKVYEFPEYPEFDEDGQLVNAEELTSDEQIFFTDLLNHQDSIKQKLDELSDWFSVPGIYELNLKIFKEFEAFSLLLLINLRGELDTLYVKGYEGYYYSLLKYYDHGLHRESYDYYRAALINEFNWCKVEIQSHHPSNAELCEWLDKHCHGAFINLGSEIYFKFQDAAVHFRLIFG